MDGLYARLCEYDTLEAAYETVYLDLADLPDNDEEWLMNLHNHLVWQTYEPGEDEDADAVVLAAITSLIGWSGIARNDITDPMLRRIVSELTEV